MRSDRHVNGSCVLAVALLLTGFGQTVVQPHKIPAKSLTGKVVAVADGDTLTVLGLGNQQHKIRLEGIDTPERKQAFGTKAKEALAEKVFGKVVTVRWDDTDRYGRTLGHVFLGSRWINFELVRDGWGWHYKQYSDDPTLAKAEVEARKDRRGLWADSHPIPPWEFRNPPKVDAGLGEHWLTTSSGVRHNPTCKWFKRSNGRLCGPDEGRPCKLCGG